jgi:arylsulfatase A-like enzyme
LKAWNAYYKPGKGSVFEKANLQGDELTLWKYQRYMHEYHATILSVDKSVGRVLDYLKEKGLDKNTIVVYASDQGFYLGEHGWFDKRFMYEESYRTPLLIFLARGYKARFGKQRYRLKPRFCPDLPRCHWRRTTRRHAGRQPGAAA